MCKYLGVAAPVAGTMGEQHRAATVNYGNCRTCKLSAAARAYGLGSLVRTVPRKTREFGGASPSINFFL